MATLIKRTWYRRGPTGHKVKHVAHGYTLQLHGKQERKTDARWSKDDAQAALAARLLERDTPPAPAAPKTLGVVAEEYLAYKRGKGKRSIARDEEVLARLRTHVGADTPIAEVTAQRIADYDRRRVTEISRRGRLVSGSTVNRELAILRHLLRLAEEWGYLDKVPRIRLSKEPEGRLRFLSEDEIPRLLEACHARAVKSPVLLPVVTLALHTGMRKGEILGLAWERVDFARGVLRLEETKSGRRREVPMNRAVYDALQPLYAAERAAVPRPARGEPASEPAGLVFRKRGGAAWGNIRTAFGNACVAAKVADFRFHDLRHTCRAWLGGKGGPGLKRGRGPREAGIQACFGYALYPPERPRCRRNPRRVQHTISTNC